MRFAEVRAGAVRVTRPPQMLAELEVRGGLRVLDRPRPRALDDLVGRQGELARSSLLRPVAQRLAVALGLDRELRRLAQRLEHDRRRVLRNPVLAQHVAQYARARMRDFG